MEPADLLAPTVDKSQVPSLHQKRIVAFINDFLINSCGFLNQFAENCESKFIELEQKMQRLEASLTIIEAKLASIPDEPSSNFKNNEPNLTENTQEMQNIHTQAAATEAEEQSSPSPPIESTVRACEDVRYKKFFKMVQFGVPANAVKVKMQAEGIDPSILDTPNLELSDGVKS